MMNAIQIPSNGEQVKLVETPVIFCFTRASTISIGNGFIGKISFL